MYESAKPKPDSYLEYLKEIMSIPGSMNRKTGRNRLMVILVFSPAVSTRTPGGRAGMRFFGSGAAKIDPLLGHTAQGSMSVDTWMGTSVRHRGQGKRVISGSSHIVLISPFERSTR